MNEVVFQNEANKDEKTIDLVTELYDKDCSCAQERSNEHVE